MQSRIISKAHYRARHCQKNPGHVKPAGFTVHSPQSLVPSKDKRSKSLALNA